MVTYKGKGANQAPEDVEHFRVLLQPEFKVDDLPDMLDQQGQVRCT